MRSLSTTTCRGQDWAASTRGSLDERARSQRQERRSLGSAATRPLMVMSTGAHAVGQAMPRPPQLLVVDTSPGLAVCSRSRTLGERGPARRSTTTRESCPWVSLRLCRRAAGSGHVRKERRITPSVPQRDDSEVGRSDLVSERQVSMVRVAPFEVYIGPSTPGTWSWIALAQSVAEAASRGGMRTSLAIWTRAALPTGRRPNRHPGCVTGSTSSTCPAIPTQMKEDRHR